MKTKRLDIAMVEKGLSESRSLAQRLIMEGNVRVNDQVILKASHPLHDSDEINVAENSQVCLTRGRET